MKVKRIFQPTFSLYLKVEFGQLQHGVALDRVL